MYIISVTQFYPPDGHQAEIDVYISDELFNKYTEIKELGLRFTVEVLRMTNEASICIEHPNYGDFDIQLQPAAQSIKPTVEDMIRRFDKNKCANWLEIMEETENE